MSHTRPTSASRDHSALLRQAQLDAAEAAEVLAHPGLKAAFARLSLHYTQNMRHSRPEDRDDRETAYMMLRALDALAADLRATVSREGVLRHNYRSIVRTEDDQP